MADKTSIRELLEIKRGNWPEGACSRVLEIEDYSGSCGRCGWSVEDHEYLEEGGPIDVARREAAREFMRDWINLEEHTHSDQVRFMRQFGLEEE